MRKLLATLVLSALPLAASAQDVGFEYTGPMGNFINITYENFNDKPLSNYSFQYLQSSSPNWINTLLNEKNQSSSGLSLQPAGTAFIFKLDLGNDEVYYAGAEGYGSYTTLFKDGNAYITFNTKTYGDITFSVTQMGQGSLQNLTAVPEPETYAMLLAGLGMVGAVVRRRKL